MDLVQTLHKILKPVPRDQGLNCLIVFLAYVTDSSVTALEAIFSLYLMIGILAALERTVLSDGSTAFASDLIRPAATGSLRPSAALVPGASWESNLC
ncbi:hypothetical protein QQF64_027167 [Cirrhinus molitorella]|uniref:Uncharacterized protein n=1 Tax=Cirrhinus molitorella TaxID=172907 RepID=A0ABR3NBN2_9TELE